MPFQPIRDIESLREPLDERVMAGFGGVAEYGITVRWDKNFLKIARLLVERRSQFALFGGVRFGGTITAEQAFAMGFDHIALAAGAGKPTVLDLPNGLARGVRTASDFLMALQLTGAARTDTIANMQLRLPIVVVGGGLTAIDTATESLAYYPVQVEKFLSRYETLAAELRRGARAAAWREEEREIADEFLAHARAIRAERAAAEARGPRAARARAAAVLGRLHHRLPQAHDRQPQLHAQPRGDREGPRGRHPLRRGPHARARRGGPLRPRRGARRPRSGRIRQREHTLPARSILVAAGTQPNTVLAREDADHFVLDGRYFRAVDDDGNPVTPERSSKPATPHVLLSRRRRGPLHELLRRPAPLLLRQRREGHGLGQAGLSRGEPRAASAARASGSRCRARSSRAERAAARDACTASSA